MTRYPPIVSALLLSLILLCIVLSAHAYRSGDVVRIEKRSQYNLIVSEFTQVLSKHCPRFKQNRVVTLPPLDPAEYHAEKGFKLQFSIDNGRLLTPWLMVNDGKRTSLNHISLTFTYRGDDIIDIDWDIDYETVAEGEDHRPTKRVIIHYNWEEYLEQDSALAMTSMFLPAFLINLCLLVFVAAQYGVVDRGLPMFSSMRMRTTTTTTTHKAAAMEDMLPSESLFMSTSNSNVAAAPSAVPMFHSVDRLGSIGEPTTDPAISSTIPAPTAFTQAVKEGKAE